MSTRKLQALTAAAVLLAASPAHALWKDERGWLSLDGSFRTFGGMVDALPGSAAGPATHEIDGLSVTALRLIATGAFDDRVFYEIHGVQSLGASSIDQVANGSGVVGGGLGLTPQDTRYQSLDATWAWHQDENVTATLYLDRANARTKWSGVDFTVGRQAISFGKAYFWNPLDVFAPFSSKQFDRDYKTGVDAARVDLAFNTFSGMNLIAAAGRTLDVRGGYLTGPQSWDASWYGSSVFGRLFTTYRNWDLSAQGGKIYGGYQAGAGTVGEIAKVQVRGELVWRFADHDDPLATSPFNAPIQAAVGHPIIDDYAFGVAGLGRRFENTLDIEVEYLFNGGGHSRQFDLSVLRMAAGETLQLSKHTLGVRATYEILPILVGSFGALLSMADSPSAQLQPGLDWSLSDNATVLFGAIVNIGERPDGLSPLGLGVRSEFGASPDLYYTQLRYFF